MPRLSRCDPRRLVGFTLCALAMAFFAGPVGAAESDGQKGYIGCGLKLQKEGWFKVHSLIDKSPAAEAGLKNDDQVIAISGTSSKELRGGAPGGKVGESVKLTVRREASEREISIKRAAFLDIYLAPALGGDAAAQTWLQWYLEGVSNAYDTAKAFDLLRPAAEQGNAFAQAQLGAMYDLGRGVPKDVAKAAGWYRKAADQGNARAQNAVGYSYEQGEGVAQNLPEAVEWYRKAALQGNARAQCNLGWMFEAGRGTPKDLTMASEWYRKAAEQGNSRAQDYLGDLYLWGKGVPKDEKTAVEWFRKAALQGNASAQCDLGWMYENGHGADKDPAAAREWYRKSAEQGNSRAQDNLGNMYYWGNGVAKDVKAAADWYLKSAQRGNSAGAVDIAYCYLNGTGLARGERDAYAWFYYAAQQNERTAKRLLGYLYESGVGVPRDYQAAFHWYEQAGQDGDHDAERAIGDLYWNGSGVKKDSAMALQWFRKASDGEPKNYSFRICVVAAMLKVYLDSNFTTEPDLPYILATFHSEILFALCALGLVFVLGCATLLYFTIRAGEKVPGYFLSAGWLLFFFESQAAGLMACFALGVKNIGLLLCIPALVSAVPIIGATLGPMRKRLWAPSEASWRWLLLYGCGALLAISLIEWGCDALYLRVFHVTIPQQPTVGMLRQSLTVSALFTWLCGGLLIPIAEEIIFRGYLYDALRRRLSARTVILITSALFALLHCQWIYIVPLFAMGVIQGWARHKTGSLRLPAALHVINNTLALVCEVWLSR